MKPTLKTLTALALCLAPLASNAEESSPSWLFVQTASGFQVEGDVLTLPYEREIFGFTDRPNRMHGHLNAHQFETLWDERLEGNFTASPPNAVLTWLADGEIAEAEIELISAKADDFGRSIRYAFAFEEGDALPSRAANISLFIDNAVSDAMLDVANSKYCDVVLHISGICAGAAAIGMGAGLVDSISSQ